MVKYIGFSAHSEWAVVELMNCFDFDTVTFPINLNYCFNENQGQKVIEKAQETNKGILAIKSLAQRRWLKNEEKIITLGLSLFMIMMNWHNWL